MRRLDDVRLDHHIVVEEIGRIGVVGQDAADLGGGDEDRMRALIGHELSDLGLIAQVDPAPVLADDLAIASRFKSPDDGRADHAAMARHPDPLARQRVSLLSHVFAPLKESMPVACAS